MAFMILSTVPGRAVHLPLSSREILSCRRPARSANCDWLSPALFGANQVASQRNPRVLQGGETAAGIRLRERRQVRFFHLRPATKTLTIALPAFGNRPSLGFCELFEGPVDLFHGSHGGGVFARFQPGERFLPHAGQLGQPLLAQASPSAP